MRTGLALLGVVVVGCGPSRPPGESPQAADACIAAGHNLAGHEPSEPLAEGTPERERLDARMAATCRDTAWSAELIACMTDTVELADYGPCRALLTEEQHGRLEGAWGDPEVAGGEPAAEPEDGGLCDGIEALIAAGHADAFESIKGEQTSDDVLAPTWAVTLPAASACSLVKIASFPAYVNCPIAEHDDYEGMVGAYRALVELLDACALPDDWTRSESTGTRTGAFGGEEFGSADDMDTAWGSTSGLDSLSVTLHRDDPAYPYRLGFSITTTPP